METIRGIHSGFLRACERFGDRPALEVDGVAVSYVELRTRAAGLAATLDARGVDDPLPLTAVYAQRSVTTYAAVLATLWRGRGYVPLNPSFPAERTRAMLERAGCREVVVDCSGEERLDSVLEGIRASLVLVLPERDDVSELARRWPMHTFLGTRDLVSPDAWTTTDSDATFRIEDPDHIANLLFTSGSSGAPKGIVVSVRNLRRFIDVMVDRYRPTEADRFSQLFDLSFDLAGFDMFVAWERGACVCCPSREQLLTPGRFLSDARLTIWFSVPSTGLQIKQLGFLSPGAYPTLRLSLFCGEGLPAELVEAWASAAPNSVIENLYGPTELTLACTLYRWDSERSLAECENGLAPIGDPYPGMTALIADEALREVAPGETGELLMTGPQLTPGYWRDPERTAKAFLVPPGRDAVYYRTGDRVRRPSDGGPIKYLGRLDQQVQIRGARAELGEIEAALRELAGVDTAVALAWPVGPAGAEGVVAFLAAADIDINGLRRALRDRLPMYMVPREIRLVAEFPLNVNGKIDRKALLQRINDESPNASPK